MILRAEELSKAYRHRGGRRIALEGVSLELDRGEVLGIFGAAGAGKTTLLRLLAGLERPDHGRITYAGEPLELMSGARRARYLRREVGCVWRAEAYAEGMRVLENVMLPLLIDHRERRWAERRARRVLLACEADQCIDMEVQELSDGERQLVAIARALVSEPRVLLVDGVVTDLSLHERNAIMRLLSSLAKDAKIAVVVTGAQAVSLPQVDTLLYMSGGRLVNERPLAALGEVVRLPVPRASTLAADA